MFEFNLLNSAKALVGRRRQVTTFALRALSILNANDRATTSSPTTSSPTTSSPTTSLMGSCTLHQGLTSRQPTQCNIRRSLHRADRHSTTMKPEVQVTPGGHLLVDDELCIRVQGLPEGQKVTICAIMEEEEKKFESYCWFVADDDGLVDLQKHQSLGGTYTGVSSMGIFWSMIQAPGQMKGLRMMKKNLDTPFSANVSCYNGHVTMDQIRVSQPEPMISHVIERWYKSPDVTYRDVTDGRLRGRLYLPQGSGPFPGVIDLFGSAGGLIDSRAALLASRGFASLALPYFSYKDLPRRLDDLDLDYFLEAVDWLLSRDEVYSEGLGVVGVSKGGDIALLMGAHCAKVRAIVNINGCTFCATVPLKYSGDDIPAVELNWDVLAKKDGAYITNTGLDYQVKDLTPVWNNDAKILNILSEDDLCSPKECIHLMKQHFPLEKADNFRIVAYPDAGHTVEPPYTPLCAMTYMKHYDIYIWFGGTSEGHAFAQEDSWRRIQQFLHDNIPKTNSNTTSSKL